jgi:NosR/NirI family transcriptional regulator, nitrous oxide reductase regulator
LIGENDRANLTTWLNPGDQALMIAGKGLFSFKGSGYVRGGIFDRIVLVQDDLSVRFHDRDHKRLGAITANGAPDFTEKDLFRIPAESGFDATKPFRIQLLVQRSVGPIEKVFTTFDLAYQLPSQYLRSLATEAEDEPTSADTGDESAAQTALWQKIWRDKTVEITVLVAMLAVLTLVFFFQSIATRNARAFFWFRIGFLTVTLVFLGW